MPGYVGRRLLAAGVLLLAASFLVFSFIRIAPGSPEQILFGGRRVTPEQIAALRDRYRLDDPFLVQYWTWLKGILRGDLGQSISDQTSVWNVVEPRIIPTLQLALYALIIILLVGVATGVVAAVRKGRITDIVLSGGALFLASIATYVSGIVLILVFSSWLGWFPTFGLGEGLWDRVYHLTLPALALSLSLTALVMRITRASVSDRLASPPVETARSRGLSEPFVVLHHGLRSSLVPILSIGGLIAGYLITGSVLVEYTFGLNGLGAELVRAIERKEFAVVQAITLLFTALFIFVSFIVDLLYFLADPRLRGQFTRVRRSASRLKQP